MSLTSKNPLPVNTLKKVSTSKPKRNKTLPDFQLINGIKDFGHLTIVGLDEVGRGAIAGPIVVAAVEISTNIAGINDSKQLSRAAREKLAEQIKKASKIIQIGSASAEEIDKLGINVAQALAYERALTNISADLFLTDFYNISKKPFLKAVKGDQLFYHVAAASIVAKVYRDQLMVQLAAGFPNYNWGKNAGYGTAKHFDGIKKSGLSPHHRKTFLKK